MIAADVSKYIGSASPSMPRPAAMKNAGNEDRRDAVEVRRRRADRDERVHVGRLVAQRLERADVEDRAGPELDGRGERELEPRVHEEVGQPRRDRHLREARGSAGSSARRTTRSRRRRSAAWRAAASSRSALAAAASATSTLVVRRRGLLRPGRRSRPRPPRRPGRPRSAGRRRSGPSPTRRRG